MTSFDERLRARAKTEDCPLPEGFDRRLDGLLGELPARTARQGRPRALRRGLMIAAVVAALCVGGVVAAPTVLTMAEHAIDEAKVPAGFRELSQQAEYHRFSSGVGESVTDQGITLTVDDIAVDDTFITIFYTIQSENAIPMRSGTDPEIWRLRLRADGKYLEFWSSDVETELVDENTLRVIQRSPVLEVLPDVVSLEIYSDELFWGVSGTWHLAVTVDKSAPAAESLVAEPNMTFTMLGHRVTVKKVSVSPFGGGLVLSETGHPLMDFVLRDDLGNPLYQKRYGLVSGNWRPLPNFIGFTGGRADMKSITLIPYETDGKSYIVSGTADALPLTDDGENGYTLLSVEIGPEQAVATFRSAGRLGESDEYSPELLFLDADGEIIHWENTYMERTRDGETRLWTVTLTYPERSQAQLDEIAQVAFWQPNGYTLLEDQAVTIPLQ